MTYAKAWQWRYNHRNADVCDITARTVRKLVWREKKCWRCDETQNHPKNVTLFGGVLYMHFWTPTAIITSFVINPDGNEVPKETTMSVNMWQQDEKQNDHKTWWKHWPISGPFGFVRKFLSLVFNVMLILKIRIGMRIIDITTFMIVTISNFWTYLSILTTLLCFVNFIFNTTNDNNSENHYHDDTATIILIKPAFYMTSFQVLTVLQRNDMGQFPVWTRPPQPEPAEQLASFPAEVNLMGSAWFKDVRPVSRVRHYEYHLVM